MLYLVANHYMHFYNNEKPSDIVPLFRDSAVHSTDSFHQLGFNTMRYFPGQVINSILIVCGLDISDPKAEANVESILGSGSTVFMSRDALYVARNDYSYQIMPTPRMWGGIMGHAEEKTTFYKFGIKDGTAKYQAQATADGHVLNQYSMDEHNGYFRVAMTTNQWSEENSKSALTIFDPAMKKAGSIEDIAPGERIYSARFMGDRAFMVTFRTVDPFFAMDLSDPYNPKMLGELKIPGYSDYLHPLDENHIIGLGRDTEEMRTINSRGDVINTWVVNKGIKISLFDVTDMKNPKEISVVGIGNEYTHSEALHNPRAWLLCRENGFAAFPVTHYDYGPGMDGDQHPNFNGVYVYDIDTSGIKLRGTIQIGNKPPVDWNFYEDTAQRVLYIGDTLYTASGQGMQANQMGNLRYVRSVRYGR
jgi:uncharacterized secreted protein with C-terminal beta-propeller domain